MKLSDYVVSYIEKLGVKDIFLITGGGSIHLDDSIGKSKKIRYICNHHEQASAIAAEGYSRINGFGVCVVTTGPGGTNALTGVIGAWLDSIPVLYISGQVKRETIGAGFGYRQIGDQEINIVDIVKPVTKYAVTVMDPKDIRCHLEKAVSLAKTGRPGPVWIDIPLDVQGAQIDEDTLLPFQDAAIQEKHGDITSQIEVIFEKIQHAKRPVVFFGNGIRLAGAVKEALIFCKRLKIPVLTGFAGSDVIAPDKEYYVGHPGTIGQRVANFVLQNSDVLLVVGSRLNIRMTGYNFPSFARSTYMTMVDIDTREMDKKAIHPDMKIHADAKVFLEHCNKFLEEKNITVHAKEWSRKIAEWQKKYPQVLPEYRKEKSYVNPYVFIEMLSKFLQPSDAVILSNATASICTYQALRFPQGARVLTNSGCAAMGYGLPAAIGACFARMKKRTICIEGDGSLQLNIQELQTIIHHKLPIKLFVYNNGGYVSIRLTQKNLFHGHYVGSGDATGISIPDLTKIAKAYGFQTWKIHSHADMERKMKEILKTKGPAFCEIMVSPNMEFLPKASSVQLANGQMVSRPLEDMYPIVSREELKDIMYIPLWEG